MTLAEYYRRRRRLAAPGTKGRAARGLASLAVLSRRHVALLLGLTEEQVASEETRALGRLRRDLEPLWRHNQ
jgi:hypothetical protein